jgi:hypothetical protein
MTSNNFQQKMDHIKELLLITGIDEQSSSLLEELDNIRVAGILQADKHCRKLKMGRIPWSPELQHSIDRIRYFRACCAKYGRIPQKISPRVLAALLRRTEDKHKVTTFHEAMKLLKEEFIEYNELKKIAATLRHSFLEELAQAQAEQSGSR